MEFVSVFCHLFIALQKKKSLPVTALARFEKSSLSCLPMDCSIGFEALLRNLFSFPIFREKKKSDSQTVVPW
jgi:hypothetical protein